MFCQIMANLKEDFGLVKYDEVRFRRNIMSNNSHWISYKVAKLVELTWLTFGFMALITIYNCIDGIMN